jgi:tetratricopeptide (TPR) repeat protein
MNNLANSYEALGRHTDALKVREETLALRKAKLGPDHPDTLMSKYNLARSYTVVGRYAEAIKLCEETLALQKAKLGSDHPETLRCMHNLAETYSALGRHADALKLHEEALSLRKAKLGPDHPDTLASMCSLGASYGNLRTSGAVAAGLDGSDSGGADWGKSLPLCLWVVNLSRGVEVETTEGVHPGKLDSRRHSRNSLFHFLQRDKR